MNIEALRVLYIEDEPSVAQATKSFLTPRVKTLHWAKDGIQALQLFKENQFDVLVVDINIPKMNGLDFIEAVRKITLQTKIIILTAHKETEYVFRSTSLKITKFLFKPLDVKELYDALNLCAKEISSFEIVPKRKIFISSDFWWDLNKEALFNQENEIRLSQLEKNALKLLAQNANQSISYESLIICLWGEYDNSKLNNLKNIIKSLRAKLFENAIENIHSVGYKLQLK